MKYSVLAELEKRVKDLETAIKIDSDIIREKDAQISHWQKSAESKGRVIKRLEQQIKEKDARIAELEAENILKGTTDQEYKKMLLSKNKTIKRGFEINKQLASAVIDLDNNENIDQETIELAKQILEGK